MHSRYLYPVIVGVLGLFLGVIVSSYLHLYTLIPHFDKLMHAFEGFIVAWFFSIFYTTSLSHLSGSQRLILLVAMAGLVGILWEFAEYASSVLTPNHFPGFYGYFHGGNLPDTLIDLLADLFGGLLFFVWFIRK